MHNIIKQTFSRIIEFFLNFFQRLSLSLSKDVVNMSKKESITYLCQEDFENGCYIIKTPGKYVLTENIYCNYRAEEQLLPNGLIDATFTGNSNSARASIGIGIICDDVTIDGNGYTISQTLEGAAQNRLFTAISLSGSRRRELTKPNDSNVANPNKKPSEDCPPVCPHASSNKEVSSQCKFQDLPTAYFGNNNFTFGGGGPSDRLANENAKHMSPAANREDIGCNNITIENMNFGRSSHFNIHGSNNNGLTIRKCNFFEFEVAAIWLNNQIGLVMEDLNIVGLKRYVQPITSIWAFRTQGTGLKGVVNASYWGIILNEAQGGVGIIFPPKSGGPLTCPTSGTQGDLQMKNIQCIAPENADGITTEGGINHQRIGPRGPVLKNIEISHLETQAINGYVLARLDKNGNTVPVLFNSDAANSKTGTKEQYCVGGGHAGYRAKIALQIEAIRDGYAWYPNIVSWLWYKYNTENFQGRKIIYESNLGQFLNNYKVMDQNGLIVSGWNISLLHTYKLYRGNNEVKECNLTRLADRAIIWDEVEGKPMWDKVLGSGLREYRGEIKKLKDPDYLDRHLFNTTNVYYDINKNRKDKKLFRDNFKPAMVGYESDQVKCFSTSDGRHYYRDDNDEHFVNYEGVEAWGESRSDGLTKVNAKGYRASRVIALVNNMLVNHAGPDKVDEDLELGVYKPKGWRKSSNFRYQESPKLPIDFGGHEFNGLVSIHCDRIWGGMFENINIVNSANMRMMDTYGVNGVDSNPVENLGVMAGYSNGFSTFDNDGNLIDNTGEVQTNGVMGTGNAHEGFSGSSWGIMINDSGGNIFKNCNVLNMMNRVGAGFALHSGFGSRGNLFENCRVMSCSAEQIWGFIVDKSGEGNLFKNCLSTNMVGSLAAAGFLIRGTGNVVEDCRSYDNHVYQNIEPSAKHMIRLQPDPGNTYRYPGMDTNKADLKQTVAVAAGFLLDRDGADESEFNTRYIGSNVLRRCEFHGCIAEGIEHLDRNKALGIDKEVIQPETTDRPGVSAYGIKIKEGNVNNYIEDCHGRYVRSYKEVGDVSNDNDESEFKENFRSGDISKF